MKVEELVGFGIPEKYVEKFKEEKISKLYKPQEDVIRKGLFKEKNLILSLPTASGKTLIATIALINKLMQHRQQKAVYIAPLVALANEKYRYFKNFFGKDYKVAISVGDLDSSDSWLADYDVICVTTEKLDSILRHNVEWVNKIGLVIVDEIHMMGDPGRGPTLEILLTKLMKMAANAQTLGLSATISNADEIARWLNADLVVSDFRPVKLYEGVAFNSAIHFDEKDGYTLNGSAEVENSIIENTLNLDKQALIFTSTRRNAESLAERLRDTIDPKLKQDERKNLSSLSNEMKNVLETPTQQCTKLAECIKSGVAFHHAGLLGKQKNLIEDNFRKGIIKTIVATPTLAMGVNLPAFRVLIRDYKRYYAGTGSSFIPVLEYKQFVGRAGRPTYDSFGESVLIAKSEDEAKDLIKHFIFGQPEEIISKLALEPILRMHILALVASEFCNSEESLYEFFNRTFYAFHYGDIYLVDEKIQNILSQLAEWSLIKRTNSRLVATTIGKRVSQLYIDPLTAYKFLKSFEKHDKKQITEFSFLQLMSNSLEMRPLVSVKTSEVDDIQKLVFERHTQILQDIPEEYDIEFEEFLDSIKTTLMYEYWIKESSEDNILTKFKVAPGELHTKLQLIDWLVYSLHELALLSGHRNLLNPIRKLRVRLKYGVKEDLLPLVRLRGIGRIRARRLFDAGIGSIDKLKQIPIQSLSAILGSKVASEIKNQLVRTSKTEDEQNILSKF